MQTSKTVQSACQVLRARVRFENASLSLSSGMGNDEDTQRIREATRIYTETWVVPLLNAIERGDTQGLKRWCMNAPRSIIN